MKWTDDSTMQEMTETRIHFQLAMYAAQLGCGETIKFRQIQLTTIKLYLKAVADFMNKFGEDHRDVRMMQLQVNGNWAPPL